MYDRLNGQNSVPGPAVLTTGHSGAKLASGGTQDTPRLDGDLREHNNLAFPL